jgi:hypothetical protein
MRLVQIPPGATVASEAPFKVRNRLVEHPLFEPERIKTLLRRLPRDKVEIRSVEMLGSHDGSYKRGALQKDADPVGTFERLLEKPSWMLLHETWEHDAEYGELLRQYVRDLSETLPGMGDDISDLGCWMFLSSGRCVVHFHADPDQSFLNQIRGSKTVYVYPARMLPDEVCENLVYTHDQGTVVHFPDYEQHLFEPAHIAPGESVFLPLYAPHRVTNDDGLSISWNVGFHTRASRRRRDVHLVNLELRRMGLRPRPFNRSPLMDSLKLKSRLAFRVKNKLFPFLKPKVRV